jgi:hypothetical protein
MGCVPPQRPTWKASDESGDLSSHGGAPDRGGSIDPVRIQ